MYQPIKPKWGIAFGVLALPGYLQAQVLPEKPNILLIITDQQSAEAMSFNLVTKHLNTPNMDNLARHGVTFSNAYCANPLCVPSRSSMFTGRYPHQLDIQTNETKRLDPEKFPMMGTIFSRNEYETGYVGKWHLPYDAKQKESHGFQFTENIKNNGVDSLLPGSASKFLSAKHEKPFLLVVSFVNPHNICEWPRGQKLPDGDIGTPPPPDQCPPLRPNALPSGNESDVMKLIRNSYQLNPMFPVGNFTEAQWRQYIWSYYRMIEKTDAEIGKILNTLKKNGLDKNTLIVFLSDHGDCQGAHQWNQKTVFFEEAAKVPLIVSHPSIAPGKSEVLINTGIDLMPTLCDFAGISGSFKPEGISLKPALIHQKLIQRDYVVVSDKLIQGEAINNKKPEPEGRMLRNKRFKYWIYNEGQRRETLYDLQEDSGEMINLAGNPKYAAELLKCRKEIYEWARQNNDPFIQHLIQP